MYDSPPGSTWWTACKIKLEKRKVRKGKGRKGRKEFGPDRPYTQRQFHKQFGVKLFSSIQNLRTDHARKICRTTHLERTPGAATRKCNQNRSDDDGDHAAVAGSFPAMGAGGSRYVSCE